MHSFPAYPQMNMANVKAREAIRRAQEILEAKQRAEEDKLLQVSRCKDVLLYICNRSFSIILLVNFEEKIIKRQHAIYIIREIITRYLRYLYNLNKTVEYLLLQWLVIEAKRFDFLATFLDSTCKNLSEYILTLVKIICHLTEKLKKKL